MFRILKSLLNNGQIVGTMQRIRRRILREILITNKCTVYVKIKEIVSKRISLSS
jgi:hypothetical protein